MAALVFEWHLKSLKVVVIFFSFFLFVGTLSSPVLSTLARVWQPVFSCFPFLETWPTSKTRPFKRSPALDPDWCSWHTLNWSSLCQPHLFGPSSSSPCFWWVLVDLTFEHFYAQQQNLVSLMFESFIPGPRHRHRVLQRGVTDHWHCWQLAREAVASQEKDCFRYLLLPVSHGIANVHQRKMTLLF